MISDLTKNTTQPIVVPHKVLADILLYIIISVEVCDDVLLDPTDPPGKPVVGDSAKNFIKIQWKKPNQPVTGYNIYRKDPSTGTWNKFNDQPITVGVAVLCIISRLFARQKRMVLTTELVHCEPSLLLFVIGCYA